MRILGIDTSSRAASCAWLEDGALLGEVFTNASIAHSATLLPMLESMLGSIGRKAADADVLAVTCGPGSFTGLRIGIGAVKGIAEALCKPCIAVSTLHALALNLRGFPGLLVPVMDARAGQVYTALFRSGQNGLARVHDDQAVPIGRLYELLLAEAPAGSILLGDGALLCQKAFSERGLHVEIASPTLLHQRAGSVCLAAAELVQDPGALLDAASLEPRYLRLPQAERERLEREKQMGIIT